MRIECQGTTEITTGHSIKSNFVFEIAEDAIPALLANECKVRTRASHRKYIGNTKDGDTVIVQFYMNGDKVSSKVTDTKELRKAELMEIITSNASPDEIVAAATELKTLL